MIADTEVVDSRVGNPTVRRAQSLGIAVGRFERGREESDADTRGRETIGGPRWVEHKRGRLSHR